MAILLLWLDALNSYKSMMISLGKTIPPGMQDVAGISAGKIPRPLLDYYVGVKVRRFEPKARDQYDLLLVKNEPGGMEQVDAGWREIWEGARAGDTREHFRLYERQVMPPEEKQNKTRRKHPPPARRKPFTLSCRRILANIREK
jgi:hypothetical protein